MTTETQAYNELVAGPVKIMDLLCEGSGTVAYTIGQVLEFDSATNHNFKKYVSGCAAHAYAVVAATTTLTADGYISCIVSGEVNFYKLDATAQADVDIVAALLKAGIIPRKELRN